MPPSFANVLPYPDYYVSPYESVRTLKHCDLTRDEINDMRKAGSSLVLRMADTVYRVGRGTIEKHVPVIERVSDPEWPTILEDAFKESNDATPTYASTDDQPTTRTANKGLKRPRLVGQSEPKWECLECNEKGSKAFQKHFKNGHLTRLFGQDIRNDTILACGYCPFNDPSNDGGRVMTLDKFAEHVEKEHAQFGQQYGNRIWSFSSVINNYISGIAEFKQHFRQTQPFNGWPSWERTYETEPLFLELQRVARKYATTTSVEHDSKEIDDTLLPLYKAAFVKPSHDSAGPSRNNGDGYSASQLPPNFDESSPTQTAKKNYDDIFFTGQIQPQLNHHRSDTSCDDLPTQPNLRRYSRSAPDLSQQRFTTLSANQYTQFPEEVNSNVFNNHDSYNNLFPESGTHLQPFQVFQNDYQPGYFPNFNQSNGYPYGS